MEKERDNLKGLLEKGITIDDFVAVRVDNLENLNSEGGDTFYSGPYRPTLHFSLNHKVRDHNFGSWSDVDVALLQPFNEFVDSNKENFYGGTGVDVFTVGPTKLNNYKVLKKDKNEGPQEFHNRVNEKIEEMGYSVLPGGMHQWADSMEGSRQMLALWKDLGKYYFNDENFYQPGKHMDGIFGLMEFTLDDEYLCEDSGGTLRIYDSEKGAENSTSAETMKGKKEFTKAWIDAYHQVRDNMINHFKKWNRDCDKQELDYLEKSVNRFDKYLASWQNHWEKRAKGEVDLFNEGLNRFYKSELPEFEERLYNNIERISEKHEQKLNDRMYNSSNNH